MKNLSIEKLESIKGGAGVPFTVLETNGCGPVYPNLNGYESSIAALINAGVFGAPLIINQGTNNGMVCPG